jgi:hypothetical protein
VSLCASFSALQSSSNTTTLGDKIKQQWSTASAGVAGGSEVCDIDVASRGASGGCFTLDGLEEQAIPIPASALTTTQKMKNIKQTLDFFT